MMADSVLTDDQIKQLTKQLQSTQLIQNLPNNIYEDDRIKKLNEINNNSVITLSDDQQEDFERIYTTIAPNHPVILNTSPTGAGKTITALNFALRTNTKRIIVICNGSLQINHWETHGRKYGFNNILVMSYDTLRGSRTILVKGKQMISHGLLCKNGEDFEPSEAFMSYVEEGLLFICDECHLIKNDCAKTNAVKTLSRYITIRSMTQPLPHFKSWSFFASMTPFDKLEHVVNFTQVCGVIRSDQLYCKISNKPTGIYELYQYCRRFEEAKTDVIWGTYDIKAKNVNDVAYRLIVEIFLRLISSFTKNCHRNYLSKQSVYYAYFDIEPMGIKMMKRALEMIKASVVKNKKAIINGSEKTLLEINQGTELTCNNEISINDTQVNELNMMFNSITVGSSLSERDGVIHGMKTTQTVKTYFSLLSFIRTIFSTVRNSKVVVFLNYKEAIDIIMRNLCDYKPVKITGDPECTDDVRNSIRDKFNEPNLDCRLLIIISQVGSDGIELDDKHGDYPRIGLGFPDFYHSRFFQCPGRLFRRFTKSNSLFFWCLVNSEECPEESVFKSINEKSKVMEETLQNNQIIPPIYYEKIVNPDRQDLNKLLRESGMINPKIEEPAGLKESKVIQITRSSISKRF